MNYVGKYFHSVKAFLKPWIKLITCFKLFTIYRRKINFNFYPFDGYLRYRRILRHNFKTYAI